MNQGIKAKWVAALRSGAYQQGQGALKSDDKFCCLGVLCDLYAIENNARWYRKEGVDDSMEGALSLLPHAVRLWADLESDDPVVQTGDISPYNTINLSEANDTGVSFEQIATLIEKGL